MEATQEAWFRSQGQEDPREEGMATQYSFLENPTDRGARRAAGHGVAELEMMEATWHTDSSDSDFSS